MAETLTEAELRGLSDAATSGEWMPAWYVAYDPDGGPSETCRDGICEVPSDDHSGDLEPFMSGRQADEDFVIALVNAYRAGRLALQPTGEDHGKG